MAVVVAAVVATSWHHGCVQNISSQSVAGNCSGSGSGICSRRWLEKTEVCCGQKTDLVSGSACRHSIMKQTGSKKRNDTTQCRGLKSGTPVTWSVQGFFGWCSRKSFKKGSKVGLYMGSKVGFYKGSISNSTPFNFKFRCQCLEPQAGLLCVAILCSILEEIQYRLR